MNKVYWQLVGQFRDQVRHGIAWRTSNQVYLQVVVQLEEELK